MSFEKPERPLSKGEWDTLVEAAVQTADTYRGFSGSCLRDGDTSGAIHWANKAEKIFRVLINIENEYYEAHPDEDPDKTT